MKAILFASIALFACGHEKDKGESDESPAPSHETKSDTDGNADTDPDEDTVPTRSSLYTESLDAVGECNTDKEGVLVYVKDDGFYACVEEIWIQVDTKGEKGEAGTDGIAGGKEDRIHCTSPLDNEIDSDTDEHVWPFVLDVMKYRDGSYMLHCSSRFSDDTYTYANTSSGLTVYGPKSVGVENKDLTCLAWTTEFHFFPVSDAARATEDTTVTMSCAKVETFN